MISKNKIVHYLIVFYIPCFIGRKLLQLKKFIEKSKLYVPRKQLQNLNFLSLTEGNIFLVKILTLKNASQGPIYKVQELSDLEAL